MRWDLAIAGQRWEVRWSGQRTPPPGENHGSSGVCLAGGDVVLVSRDGETWELPAGRPERGESLGETLRREVREEACCDVEAAELLGFTTSTCVEGRQLGVVLVRAHWAARVSLMPWRPSHETVQRRVVPVAEVMSVLTAEPALTPLHERLVARTVAALAHD